MLKDTILEKRKEKNMTQEQLSEKLGVARQTVSKWETGETVPDLDSLKKLAILLEFSIDEVLGVEIDRDNDDKMDWLIVSGFIIGSALGIAFNNAILTFACTMIGFGLSYAVDVFKK